MILLRHTTGYAGQARLAIILGALLAVAAAAYWPNIDVADHAHADSVDYELPALNALNGRGFVHWLNGEPVPPCHPIGLAAMMLPCYALLGQHPGNGVWAVFLSSIACVGLAFLIATRIFGPGIGLVSGLLLCLAPAWRFYSSNIAPDAGPSALVALGCFLLANSKLTAWRAFALGNLIGAGMLLRLDNILLLIPIAALLWCR